MSATFGAGAPNLGNQPGLGGLIGELLVRVGDLIKSQIELTKIEAKVEGRKLAVAGLLGLTAITIGSIFLMLLGLSVLLVLAEYLQFIWATLITTGIFLALTILFGWLSIWELKRNSAYIDV